MEILNEIALNLADKGFFAQVGEILTVYWPFFLQGAAVTLFLAITGTLTGSLLGLLIGVVRTIPYSKRDSLFKRAVLKIVNIILNIYIEVFRGTPMIVQASVIFFGIAWLYGYKLPFLLAGYIIISINTGAYMAEIVRGGIISIDKGQFEAAHSVGMNHIKTMVFVVMPQVIRNILPATGNEFIINIKDSSVLFVIGVVELFTQAKIIGGNTFANFQVYLIAAAIYLVMTYSISRLLRLLERKLEGKKTYTIHGSQTVPEAEIKVRDDRHER